MELALLLALHLAMVLSFIASGYLALLHWSSSPSNVWDFIMMQTLWQKNPQSFCYMGVMHAPVIQTDNALNINNCQH